MKIVIIDTDLALGWYLRFDISGRDAYYNDYLKGLSDKQLDIHSKSEKVCGVCFSVTKKSAEKVRKSRHKNFATKVRKSIKSLKMHHLKAKCKQI